MKKKEEEWWKYMKDEKNKIEDLHDLDEASQRDTLENLEL